MQYNDLKKYIYKLDPESAHHVVETLLKNIGSYAPIFFKPIAKMYKYKNPKLSQELFGVTFPNPVGLAAGFDKNATMIKGLEAIGFGFIEFGTVTPKAQPGNEKPRLFRFPDHKALQNAMGFNNEGMEFAQNNVKKLYPFAVPLGANIGKNKNTSSEDALEDYRVLIDGFKDLCDYIIINISSPNTPGLRDLQNEAFIKSIFEMATEMTNKPVLLKIAPDLEIKDALDICQIAIDHGAEGIIATNTTIDYTLLPDPKDIGGISGEVLCEKSFTLFEALAKAFYGKTTLISVGGISNGNEAYRRLKAGASLVQTYSALIFEGPILARKINEEILTLMEKDGYDHINEVIGADRQ
ncbi:MAG: quinone-dependent dihydroorotate dehydrogenase [Epsilonproteobacteria bacterium]|nr:quinone-dependent dihydroorotate dehydrogenase [Campylobacterota bacterium]